MSGKPSNEFLNALFSSATYCSIDCHHGITHFIDHDENGGYEDGELDGLRESEAKKPEKYNSYNVTSIGHTHFMGRDYVDECNKCLNHLTKYEGFLDENFYFILEYYKAKNDTENREQDRKTLALSQVEECDE